LEIYIIQANLELGNIQKNKEKIFSYLEKAKKGSLVVMPEMWSSGFDNENLEEHAKATPEIYKELKDISRKKHLVLAGTLPELSKKNIYNKGYIIDNGELIHKRAKVKLFTPTNEHKYFKAGKNSFDITESSVGNLGMMICFELRYPNISYSLRKKDVEIILVPAQWGKPRKKHLEILSNARAIETQSFVAVSNTVGKIGDIEYAGSSAVYSPWGECLINADDKEGIFKADVDLTEVYKVRRLIKMDI